MVTQARNPHYLLFSEATGSNYGDSRWKFVLQSVGSEDQFAAGDVEPGTDCSRLELLAVVRGLEAIDQPSQVTLVTRSRYVARGIRRDLNQWRDRRWHWECFGKLVPIRDQDLWQRIDHALKFHRVDCVRWQATSHAEPPQAVANVEVPAAASAEPALLIVPRAAGRLTRQPLKHAFVRTLNRLRAGVLAQFSMILRPAFTRAA